MAKIKVMSEVSGSVWKVLVSVGDMVEEDQQLAILESMKMEIPVLSPCSGTIESINIQVGNAIGDGDIVAVVNE